MKAFLARDLDGRLLLYSPTPPIRTGTQWLLSSPKSVFIIDNDLFPEVKWEDEEPTEINIEIVNKHK